MTSLSSLIGTYICGINSKRADIIRIFTYADVFEKKAMRKSYFQSIINISATRSYELVLEKIVEENSKEQNIKDKLLCSFRVHYKEDFNGKYYDGYIIVLRSSIKICKFDAKFFNDNLMAVDLSSQKELDEEYFFEEKEIKEILILETM